MNRNRYRLVRNAVTNLWTPVPENARSRGKGMARALLLAPALLGLTAQAGSLPTPCAAGACGTNPNVPGFVTHGSAGYAVNGQQAVVSQVGDKAILNWQNFNVGQGNSVTFQQVQDLASRNAVAGANFNTLNRIWQADPSVIAGAINVAAGQKGNLTFINQNGIVFTGTAQVDVNTLTASSLNMADKFFLDVLTPVNNTVPQFSGTGGFIKVLDGARISAASGGRVMLLAPTVTSQGKISTPDGQTILAAGNKAYLTAVNDTNLRGLMIEVDSPAGLNDYETVNSSVPASVTLDGETHAVAGVHDKTGHASNLGEIVVGTGNATLAGYAVNQMGRVSATTSVLFNGSIYLTAKDTVKDVNAAPDTVNLAAERAGRVILGAGSRTAILPELDAVKVKADLDAGRLRQVDLDAYYNGDAAVAAYIDYMSTGTILDAQTFKPSVVRVVGQDIRVEANALVKAPAGQVDFYAVDDPSLLKIYNRDSLQDPFTVANSATSAKARVQFAKGAKVDVAGLEGVAVSVARNMVQIKLQGDELKDSPINRNGPIRGESVWVDVTLGSPLVANLSDYKAAIGRSVAELSTTGGGVNLNSQGEVVVPGGVSLDVSGGYVDYTGATTKVTLLSANGRQVEMANASPDTYYDAVVSRVEITDPRWGITTVYDQAENRYNPGYREGKNAGGVEILARHAVFDADIVGHTSPGLFQNASGKAPLGASLKIGKPLDAGGGQSDNLLMQRVNIGNASGLSPNFGFGDILPVDLRNALGLSQHLFGGSGVNRLEIYSNDAVAVDRALRVAPTGSVKLVGKGVSVNADIQAAAGAISLAGVSTVGAALSVLDVRLADGVKLDVSGAWVNDGLSPSSLGGLRAVHAGDISVNTLGDLVLGAGSVMDVTGGAYIGVDSKIKVGNGGDLSLSFLNLRSDTPGIVEPLQSHIASASPGAGGSLALSLLQAEIGPSSTNVSQALRFDPSFFRQGFAKYAITGLKGVDVLDNTQISVRTSSRDLMAGARLAVSGSDLKSFSTVVERDETLRQSADLNLKAGVYSGATSVLRIGEGVRLDMDPEAEVKLAGSKRVDILGGIYAPAGAITVTLSKDLNAFDYDATDSIRLGHDAVLSAAGAAQVYSDNFGRRLGDVLAGGVVTLNAVTGYVVGESGAIVDVSGVVPTRLDLPNANGGLGVLVAGDAGALTIAAREGVWFDATLIAQGGDAHARAGTFSLSLGNKDEPSSPGKYPTGERILTVGTASPALPTNLHDMNGLAFVEWGRLEGAGFETINLKSLGRIRFDADLMAGTDPAARLAGVRLDAPNLDLNNHQVSLSAWALQLGNYDPDQQTKAAVTPVAGSGLFSADATYLELAGTTAWSGVSQLNFGSDTELRFTGVRTTGAASTIQPSGLLDTQANILFSAGTLSPSTLTKFIVHTPGDVTITSHGRATVPYSAMGELSIQANDIAQGGRIHAPYGRVELNAANTLTLEDGSVTSVAGVTGITPFGMTVNGRSWIYDYGDGGKPTITSLGQKTVSLSGADVQMLAGAEVDVSGLGDLQAWEFTVGPGGSKDVLAESNVYAVLPGYSGLAAPSDPQNAAGFDLAAGASVWLEGVAGLSAGVYTLLPAHYALLPGAYMIRLDGAKADLLPGQGSALADGALRVSGYLTDARGSVGGQRYSGFTLLSQAEVRKRSEFGLLSADDYFADASGVRPGDAGQLSVTTSGNLALLATLTATNTTGQGAAVDINAPRLAVVSGLGEHIVETGAVRLDVSTLAALRADSLLLGGTRALAANGETVINVGAVSVEIDNDPAHALAAREIMLAATGTVALHDDSNIVADGAGGDSGVYSLSGDGAFLLAAATDASLVRTGNPARQTGVLTSDGGVQISAARSVILDATKDNSFAGSYRFEHAGKTSSGTLNLGASSIHFGVAPNGTQGLMLDQAGLSAFGDLDVLRLRSYSSVDFYGDVTVGSFTQAQDNAGSLLFDANGKPVVSDYAFERLVLQGGGLFGHGNANETAFIHARELTLANMDGASTGTQPGGTGKLAVLTDTLTLGGGNLGMQGFSQIDLHARGELKLTGTGSADLAVASAHVYTPRIGAGNGADFTLKNSIGNLVLKGSDQAQTLSPASGLGAKLAIEAVKLDVDTLVELPGGDVALTATGAAASDDLALGADARVLATGKAVGFFEQIRHAPAGSVTLTAKGGNVISDANSVVDVSASGDGDAGLVQVSAKKTVALGGTVTGEATGGGRGGRFVLAADRVNPIVAATGNDFSYLNAKLEAGGFRDERKISLGSGDVTIGMGDTVVTRRFELTAEGGKIDVYGQVDASGGSAGEIVLQSQSDITLFSGAGLKASSSLVGKEGGHVLLASESGQLDLRSGSSVDLTGGASGQGGVLHLRAQRMDNADADVFQDNVSMAPLASTFSGVDAIQVEGYTAYSETNIQTADFGVTSTWYQDAKIFMDNIEDIRTDLGMAGNSAFKLLAGVEVQSAMDLVLSNDWSLHSWRYDPDTGAVVSNATQLQTGLNANAKPLLAGVLTLRAADNLTLNASLSDGFSGVATTAAVQGYDSWSYRLVGGANLNSANPLSVREAAGDFVLNAGKLVRTGTGDIAIAAGKDVLVGKITPTPTTPNAKLYNQTSVIYTAGRAFSPPGSFTVPSGAVFTRDGGDISIRAERDVTGAESNQLYSNWLFRQGRVNATTDVFDATNPQTAWWVRFDQFQQGVGALGGGDVLVAAGGTIANLSASSATNGFMAATQPDPAALQIQGGGSVEVIAGGDLLSGQYYAGLGEVVLHAGGAITSGRKVGGKDFYTIVALGDAQADISARGDVNIQAVIDPMLVPQKTTGTSATANLTGNPAIDPKLSLFSSQSGNTSEQLESLSGSIKLHNGVSAFETAFRSSITTNQTAIWSNNHTNLLTIAPGSVRATAYQGDVEILGNMTLNPDLDGALELLAGRDVSITGSANTLVMSDMDINLLPSASGSPSSAYQAFPQYRAVSAPTPHALTPTHANDVAPVLIYAAGGDVSGKTNTLTLVLPKAVRIQAAVDIKDIGVEGQNLRDTDVTLLRAGNDIVYATEQARSPNMKIKLGGPGLLEIEAGRNLDLGTSEGIVTRGDLDNPALQDMGANVHVAVGVPNGVDYQGAVDRLAQAIQVAINAGSTLDSATLWQSRWLTGDESLIDPALALVAVQQVDALSDAAQRKEVRNMFFMALRDSGRDHNDPDSPFAGDYSRGYKTIELLYPGIDKIDSRGRSLNYGGELNLFASRIKTERGGDIEFMVPGGQAVIGLAQTKEALVRTDLGMVTVEKGAIRGFAREDILVNQSRILSVGGGDILLWASEADIDAGKGKKTATSVPPPIIKIDSNGNVSVELQGVATGSGIGALSGQPGVVAGDVDLIAPKGAVNAGEAGIRAGNLNIAAEFVIGGDNIQASGTSSGVPAADTGSLSAGLAGNSSLGDAQSVQESTKSIGGQSGDSQKTAEAAKQNLASFRPSFISVEVLGFGDGTASVGDKMDEAEKVKREQEARRLRGA